MSSGSRSRLISNLKRALAVEAKAEIEFATKVGVLVALQYSRAEIGEALDATPAQVRAAVERLRRAAPHIEADLPGF